MFSFVKVVYMRIKTNKQYPSKDFWETIICASSNAKFETLKKLKSMDKRLKVIECQKANLNM